MAQEKNDTQRSRFICPPLYISAFLVSSTYTSLNSQYKSFHQSSPHIALGALCPLHKTTIIPTRKKIMFSVYSVMFAQDMIVFANDR